MAPSTYAPTAPTTPYPTGPTVCIDDDALEWRSYDNKLYLNGNEFNMKGLSWFGFETTNYNLYGLDVHDMDWYLQWMVDHVRSSPTFVKTLKYFKILENCGKSLRFSVKS